MPAPTALLRKPEALAEDQRMAAESVPLPADEESTGLIDMGALPTDTPAAAQVDATTMNDDVVMTDEDGRPRFPPAKEIPVAFRRENRKVPIPPHRMSPLKANWPKIYPPLVEHLKLQVRMNQKNKAVELRTSSHTTDTGALQKGEGWFFPRILVFIESDVNLGSIDFVKAFTLGFDVDDAIALLRLVSLPSPSSHPRTPLPFLHATY
jgi:RNA-binding protein PNO1